VPAKGNAVGHELYYYDTTNDPSVTGKGEQTITFNDIIPKVYGDVFTLEATSSAGTPVAFKSINPSLAQIEESTIMVTGTGDIEIMAYQPGDNTFCPADPVVKVFSAGKAQLMVQAYNTERVYGDANPALSFSFREFVNGDDSLSVDQLPKTSTAATDTSDVGDYDIVVSGGHDDHYEFDYSGGVLTITKAPLTATADDKVITYRDAIPVLTVSYEGFRNNDDENVLTPPSLYTEADENSDAGEYTIDVFEGDAENYEFTYVQGVLTIDKAVADINITNLTQEVDGTQKSVVVTTDPQNLNHTVTYDGSATKPIVAGTYAVLVVIEETNFQGEATAQFVLEEIVGVEKEQAVSLDVYANPVNERLIIEFKRDYTTATQLVVYSVQGQLLYRKTLMNAASGDKEFIQLQDWHAGIYHLIATDAEGQSSNYRIMKR
jgi:hypothetical protein